MFANLPDPSGLTVMVGVVPARMSDPPAPLVRNQVAALLVVVSPKMRLPIAREASSATVTSAVGFSVLKSALLPSPPAMTLPVQFVLVPQEPPAALLQVLLLQ
jgi:hypothetical protein